MSIPFNVHVIIGSTLKHGATTKKKFIVCFIVLAVFTAVAALRSEAETRGVKDVPFPQKFATRYTAEDGLPFEDIRALAFCGGRLYAGSRQGVFRSAPDGWETVATGKAFNYITALACENGKLLAGSREGLFRLDPEGASEAETLFFNETTSFAAWRGGYLIGTPKGLYFRDNGEARRVLEFGTRPVTALAVDDRGAAWIGFFRGLARYDGGNVALYRHSVDGHSLIDNHVRGLYISKAGDLYIGTGRGISRFDRRDGWKDITGADGGLPYEDVTVITGADGALWVGTTIGAARFGGDRWEYFQSMRYLPDDRVTAIAVAPDGAVWIGTPKGLSKIEYKMMTLAQKAEYIERDTRKYNVRYGLVSDEGVAKPGDKTTAFPTTNDNDGLWTSMYIAAECYRYGATGDPEAKKFARDAFEALMFLETVNEIPGFVSRSFAKPDDPHCGGEWDHITSDGKWRWKGDTSSDEIDGHYYAYSIYYDICADEAEKEEIRDKVRLITNYIVDNDYYLIDSDGLPTTFGMWNPEYLATYGRFQRGLNALEMLSYLLVAYHITGDQKFDDEYIKLAKDYNYAKHTVKQKLNQPHIINHSDDELAFLAYYPLVKYEDRSFLLEYYHKSLRRSWRIDRPEKNPLWNYMYGAVMPEGEEFDPEEAAETLRRIPMDLIYYSVRNSHRTDINIDPAHGRFKEIQALEALSPDERCMLKWNENPYKLDCDYYGGTSLEAGSFWLLPYWMGRYYGYITE